MRGQRYLGYAKMSSAIALVLVQPAHPAVSLGIAPQLEDLLHFPQLLMMGALWSPSQPWQ